MLPQVWPRLIDSLRLTLGSAWLFLIAAEAIASTEGLGYRIFLVRRYLAMDVILPYVVWITLLAVAVGLAAATPAGTAPSPGPSRSADGDGFGPQRLEGVSASQVVLENLRLEVADHEFVTIVGASGCGKTTFLKMLLGIEQPTRGEILIDGEPIRPEPGPDRGIVFQRYSLFPHLTAIGNLRARPRAAALAAAGPAVRRAPARGAAEGRGDARGGRPRHGARPLSRAAVGRHAAAAGDRAGGDLPNRRSCCSTSRSARSIRASPATCTS